MNSIWKQESELPKNFPTLNKDTKTPIAIIGCGLAGALIAYFLQQKGKKAIVLEASTIASGQTKHTTAKITSQHNIIYQKLIDNFGVEKAKQYAMANEKAITAYEQIIQQNAIDCEFERCSAYLYSTEQAQALREEALAAQQVGIDAEFTLDTELPFLVKGAVCFPNQARFHPLKFINAITKSLTIYENTPVLSVEENQIRTPNATVTAEKIIFATHFPFLNMPGYYFMRMHQERSYAIALKNAPLFQNMYLGIDQDGLSFRKSGDYLLMGGGNHRTGENSAGGQYAHLQSQSSKLFETSEIVCQWSAQDCMTLDGIPYIGQYSSSTPNWYVATGFQKWGMTSSMVSAMILSDMITEKENPYAEVFSPQRFSLSASAKNLATDTTQALKGLAFKKVQLPKAELEALEKGHGGLVEYDGDKIGVYKDENDEIFMILPKCPHLGCQLEWNPDEKSWDCPCHGSRFTYRGELLDNPAQNNLEIL